MKRIISIVVTMALLLCCVNASAAVSTLYDLLGQNYLSGEESTQLCVSLIDRLRFCHEWTRNSAIILIRWIYSCLQKALSALTAA